MNIRWRKEVDNFNTYWFMLVDGQEVLNEYIRSSNEGKDYAVRSSARSSVKFVYGFTSLDAAKEYLISRHIFRRLTL